MLEAAAYSMVAKIEQEELEIDEVDILGLNYQEFRRAGLMVSIDDDVAKSLRID